MAESNKTTLAHFPGTATCHLLRQINTVVLDPHDKLTGDRGPTVPDDSVVQVPVKHDFSEIFERGNFDGKCIGNGELHYIC